MTGNRTIIESDKTKRFRIYYYNGDYKDVAALHNIDAMNQARATSPDKNIRIMYVKKLT